MKKSRLIAFAVALAMVLSWVVVPESHSHVHAVEVGPTLTVGSLEGNPGDTLMVPVSISNNPGITALNIHVQFDASAVDVVNSVNNDQGIFGSIGDGFMGSRYDGTNPVAMQWFSGLKNFNGDGVIGFVEVNIKADAKPGAYAVQILTSGEGYSANVDMETVAFTLVAGSITVLCAGHEFGEFVSNNDATCEQDGTKTRRCELCGAEETLTEEGTKKEHAFLNYIYDNNARCTTDGTETARCAYCDLTDTRTVPGTAKGHTLGDFFGNADADCENDGTETAVCDICGEGVTRKDEGSATGHSFVGYVSNGDATCTQDGTETGTCSMCGATDTRTQVGSHENAAHSFPEEFVSDGNATCTADGTMSRSCTACGEKETVTEEGSAKGHTFTEKTDKYMATAADCCHKATYYYSCAVCGARDEEEIETFELGDFDVNNHVGGAEILGKITATEDQDGYTGDTCCMGCGAVLEKGEVIPALGHTHNMAKTEGHAATCESEGNIEYWSCSKCHKLYSDAEGVTEITAADTELAALGHSFTTYTADGNATCTADGTETAKCDRCDVTDTRTAPGSAKGHTFGEWTVTVAPTCENTGLNERKCSNCTETETKVLPALGHDMGAFTSNGDATCTADGTETSKCSRCDKSETRTAEGSMLAHSYTAKTDKYPATTADCCHQATYFYACEGCGEKGTDTFAMGEFDLNNHRGETEVRNAVAATEDQEGYTGDTYCLGCGNVTAKGEVIPVLDHTHAFVKTEAKAATCQTEGNTAYWTCLKCDKLYADAEGKNLITLADTVTAALGHSFTNYAADGNATCTADGTETAKCDRCDVTDTRTAAGSALGHDMGAFVSNGDATCETNGTETSKCSRCDKSETRPATDSTLGHAWGEWIVTTAPTCETAGEETSTCANCGKTETKVLDALGHAWGEWTVTTAPTCETAGEETSICANCGKTETKVIDALGHDMGAFISNNDAACEADGTETASCGRCGKTETRTVSGSALGHAWTEWAVTTAPTCETAGEQTRSCATCGKGETEILAALGHAWTQTEVITEATCTENGEVVFTCETCALTENRTVEAKGHDYESVVTAPTATDKGFTTHTCACGDTYVDSYVDPIPEETKPVTPDDEDDDVPETGDNTHITLWAGMLLAAMMGTGALVATRKKWIV